MRSPRTPSDSSMARDRRDASFDRYMATGRRRGDYWCAALDTSVVIRAASPLALVYRLRVEPTGRVINLWQERYASDGSRLPF